MPTAGYSGKPVPTKLGLKPGMRVLLVDAPAGFQLVSDEITVLTRATGAAFDLALAFCPDAATVPKRFAALTEKITTAGALWIAWPKKSGPLAGDVGESDVREVGLAAGLVDVKVIAIDEAWSGLKFVRRLKDR
ncbi:hypothetical protein [Sporichthya sp.]|uniref:hypothetical protein n=1 Tax=Sporichthya sp. TaxID=65475 RepID=UPI0017BC50BE|nr:hypothetical protein [Sporichthya sp.]MBA3744405.1 DUF3052 family protein [Sporichthya sp.]